MLNENNNNNIILKINIFFINCLRLIITILSIKSINKIWWYLTTGDLIKIIKLMKNSIKITISKKLILIIIFFYLLDIKNKIKTKDDVKK